MIYIYKRNLRNKIKGFLFPHKFYHFPKFKCSPLYIVNLFYNRFNCNIYINQIGENVSYNVICSALIHESLHKILHEKIDFYSCWLFDKIDGKLQLTGE